MQSLPSTFFTEISMRIAICGRDEPDAVASIACEGDQLREEASSSCENYSVTIFMSNSQSKYPCSQRVGHF